MAPISVRLATEADAAAIAKIHHEAQDEFNDFYQLFFANPIHEAMSKAIHAAFAQRKDVLYVAEDAESRSVAGFVRYVVVDAADGEPAPAPAPVPAPVPPAAPQPSIWAIKPEMMDLWGKVQERGDEMDAVLEKALQGQRHVWVKHVMVEPAHHRRGIGGTLLREVLAFADAEAMPTHIDSSAVACALYARMGFESLGRWVIDNGALAAEAEEVMRERGMAGWEGVAAKFRGVHELEDAMVRWPPKQNA